MDNLTLENQAWALVDRIQKAIHNEIFTTAYNRQIIQPDEPISIFTKRLCAIYPRAHSRYLRRQAKLFNYYPGGFAPSSVQPSGVVGQGAL